MSKSVLIPPGVVANGECGANARLPYWVGKISGRFDGNGWLSLHTIAAVPSDVTAYLFISGAPCADTGEPPILLAADTVTVGGGERITQFVFEDLTTKKGADVGYVVVQLAGTGQLPGPVRVFYDSSTHQSSLALPCLPPRGASECVPQEVM
ncbi:MAG: hypothetical protein ACRD1T_20530 [Acidimicrobiia bacterium]